MLVGHVTPRPLIRSMREGLPVPPPGAFPSVRLPAGFAPVRTTARRRWIVAPGLPEARPASARVGGSL
jgi:hypothetical protein